MFVRPYRSADAEALSRLYERSVRGLGSRDYSVGQVEAWASLTPTAEVLEARMADGRARLVAADGEAVAGFVDLETDGHIDLLYVAPEAAGQGVARLLLEAAEDRAVGSGAERLYAEASQTARPAFERLGFDVLARRDFEAAGVAIYNWAVEKRL
jgi:putative acetyltransferase